MCIAGQEELLVVTCENNRGLLPLVTTLTPLCSRNRRRRQSGPKPAIFIEGGADILHIIIDDVENFTVSRYSCQGVDQSCHSDLRDEGAGDQPAVQTSPADV